MKMSKGFIIIVTLAIIMSSGLTYAIIQVNNVTRITINKAASITTISNPESLFGVRWSDRDLDQEQNVPGVTRINGDVFNGDTVTISGLMVNAGSSDLTVTWSVTNLPKGLSIVIFTAAPYNPNSGTASGGSSWTGSLTLPRSTSYNITVKCIDDGSMVEGSSIFDLVITAQ